MKAKIRLRVCLAGVVIAAALLASCYAPLANQNGYLNLSLAGAKSGIAATPTTAIVMVVDSGYQATLAEMLYLISKAYNATNTLSSTDADRLKTLGKQLATNGLVSFGGYPFYQTTLTSSTGSFEIPGIPAGKSYFVKFYVLNPNASFSVQSIDESFSTLVQSENQVFSNRLFTGGPIGDSSLSVHLVAVLEYFRCWPTRLRERGRIRHSHRDARPHAVTSNIALRITKGGAEAPPFCKALMTRRQSCSQSTPSISWSQR